MSLFYRWEHIPRTFSDFSRSTWVVNDRTRLEILFFSDNLRKRSLLHYTVRLRFLNVLYSSGSWSWIVTNIYIVLFLSLRKRRLFFPGGKSFLTVLSVRLLRLFVYKFFRSVISQIIFSLFVYVEFLWKKCSFFFCLPLSNWILF